MKNFIIYFLFSVLFSSAFGQVIATTEDDKTVVLFADGTYKYGSKVKTDNGKTLILFSDGTFLQTENSEPILIPNSKDFIEASFPGGEAAFRDYVGNEFKYPVRCQDEGINGSVVLKYFLDKTGRITQVRALEETRSCPEFTAEAIRALQKSPRWIPAQRNGQFVDSWREFPLRLTVE
jgi:hypothetical protein